MNFGNRSTNDFDNVVYGPSRRLHSDSAESTFLYDPFRYHFPMQVSELLKRFHVGENGDDADTGRESHLSIPSSSATRSSFVISSTRPSAGLSRCGTGKGSRPRFPIEVGSSLISECPKAIIEI